MKALKFASFILLMLFSLISCDKEGDSTDPIVKESCDIPLFDVDVKNILPPAPIGIGSVIVDEDCISFATSYSGGCEEHTVQLILTTITSLSNGSLHLNGQLDHSTNDLCEALLNEDYCFDLSTLALPGGSNLSITMEGWDELIVIQL